jgi:aminoglycoside phosphotransferase (APT) family kinase protein
VVQSRDGLLARDIASMHGLPTDSILSIEGQGSVNHVFVVGSQRSRSVIRFAIDPLRHDEFEVEAWCLNAAAERGIPCPRVIAIGSLRNVPYLIQPYVEDVPGLHRRSRALWRTVGRYARIVHSIPITEDAPDGLFSRFGRDLPRAWQEHLDYNVAQLTKEDPLIELGVYPVGLQAAVRSTLAGLADAHFAFGVCHGDLSLKNLLVPPTGDPVLIDWGSASAGPIPFGDLLPVVASHRAFGDPTAAELGSFAAGLGTTLADIGETLERLMLLQALDLVRWAMAKRPDRLNEVVRLASAEVARTVAARPDGPNTEISVDGANGLTR